jgi:KaiC/GvpD/RAD55 family RecA-like ATPase
MMRVASGIRGLDEMCEGGFPGGSVIVVTGPPGSGKTLFGLQFALAGGKAVYVTLEEPKENIVLAGDSIGLPVSKAVESGDLCIVDFGYLKEVEGDQDITYTFRAIAEYLEVNGPVSRLVVDSITALSIYYSEVEYRKELFKFARYLRRRGITSLLLSESGSGPREENFIADALIFLNYENVFGEYRRTLTIYKMRFTRHDPYKHPFIIMHGGFEVLDEVIRE